MLYRAVKIAENSIQKSKMKLKLRIPKDVWLQSQAANAQKHRTGSLNRSRKVQKCYRTLHRAAKTAENRRNREKMRKGPPKSPDQKTIVSWCENGLRDRFWGIPFLGACKGASGTPFSRISAIWADSEQIEAFSRISAILTDFNQIGRIWTNSSFKKPSHLKG